MQTETSTLSRRKLALGTLVLAVSLGLGAWYLNDAGAEEARGEFVIEHALPEGAMFHMHFDGRAVDEQWNNLALARLMEDEQMKAFLAPVMEMAEGMLEEPMREIEDATGMKVKELQEVMKGDLTITLADLDLKDGNGPPDADLVMTFDLRNDKALVAKLKNLINKSVEEGMGEAPKEIMLAEQRAFTVNVDGIDMIWCASGNYLIAGTKKSTLENVVTRLKAQSTAGGLFASPEFQKGHAKTAPSGRPTAFMFIDIPKVTTLAKNSPLAEEIPLDDILDGVGISGMTGFSYAMNFEGAAIVDRVFIAMKPNAGGIYGDMKHNAKPLQTTAMAPEKTLFYTGFRLDVANMVEGLLEMVAKMDEGAEAEIADMLAEFEANMGFALIDDFLANLGEEMSLWVGASPFGGMMPELVFALEVEKHDKINDCFARFAEKVGDEVPMKEFAFKGSTIRYFDTSKAMSGNRPFEPGLKPSMMMDGDMMLVALAPQTLKNYIASKHKGQRRPLRGNADLQQGLTHLKRAHPEADHDGLTYADLGGILVALIDTGAPIVQSMTMPEEMPIDMTLFPTSDVFQTHLFGFTAATTYSDDGMLSQIHSPIGYASGMMFVGAAAGAAFWAEGMGSSESSRAEIDWEDLETEKKPTPVAPVPPKETEGGGR